MTKRSYNHLWDDNGDFTIQKLPTMKGKDGFGILPGDALEVHYKRWIGSGKEFRNVDITMTVWAEAVRFEGEDHDVTINFIDLGDGTWWWNTEGCHTMWGPFPHMMAAHQDCTEIPGCDHKLIQQDPRWKE